MNTPLCDFVKQYAGSGALRLHMPGHKGRGPLGIEMLDITEIEGADVLYQGKGVIAESEANASFLFGSGRTLYSAEGSSLSIRAMTALAGLYAQERGLPCRILAARNVHRSFVSALALLDMDVEWLFPKTGATLLSCPVTADDLEGALSRGASCCAVYVTSPDYLGNTADIRALSDVCRKHGLLLLVDNAHGAYLHFLPRPVHPLDLGADIVCDSAHKTLPVLTGGAYLHLSRDLPGSIISAAESAMELFASSSPSYLILQSLDAANPYLADELPGALRDFIPRAETAKAALRDAGWITLGNEVLKISLDTRAYGYTGSEVSAYLHGLGLECEFADPDRLVMMLSPLWNGNELERIVTALRELPAKEPLQGGPPRPPRLTAVLTPRQALLAPSEELPAKEAEGRILASARFSCPPAVPIAVPGERLDSEAVGVFRYYGIGSCRVVRE